MTPLKTLIVTLLLFLLAACTREQAPDAQPPANDPADTSTTSTGATPRDPAPVAPNAPPAPSPDPAPAYTPIDSLPPTRDLVVTVEGQRESREARLFRSPQAYAIYVLPQLVMTPEEPCCDQAYARVDDGFFMRIERIDDAADAATLRADMQLALSSVGTVEEALEAEVQGYLPADARADVELAGRAMGEGVGMVMLIARIDGGRYRVTLHLPHREAVEGIAPSLWAMLGSLRTTGPRPLR